MEYGESSIAYRFAYEVLFIYDVVDDLQYLVLSFMNALLKGGRLRCCCTFAGRERKHTNKNNSNRGQGTKPILNYSSPLWR